jgi:uncharacterized membrane protein YqjE
MSPGDGTRPPEAADKSLGEIVAEVSEKASLLVREEIELAKAEVAQKVKNVARGAGVGAAAGVFLVFALMIFLHALAWFFVDLFDWQAWTGFLLTAGILVLMATVAGYLAYRWLRSGAPPTPDLAIEEARRTREALEHQKVERDQLERTLERGSEREASF